MSQKCKIWHVRRRPSAGFETEQYVR